MNKIIKNDLITKEFVYLVYLNIIKKRKELEDIINSPTFSMGDIIVFDSASREMVSDFPAQIKFLISYALKKLSKLKYSRALISLKDAFRIECPDDTLTPMITSLIEKIEMYRKLQSIEDYTISYKE